MASNDASVFLNDVVSRTNYPSGETHIQMTPTQLDAIPQNGTIIADHVRDFNGLLDCLVVENILRNNSINVEWVVPFFPYARDDRRNHQGDGSELELALSMVKPIRLSCIDPHSDVTGVLLHYSQAQVVTEWAALGLFPVDVIVAIPDAGAAKKVYSWAADTRLTQMDALVQCFKKRDVHSGRLSGFEVMSGDLCDRPVVIVDDICDGGGTFLGLADELKAKGAGDLTLAVTHGLFTKGLDILFDKFAKIYTLDIYAQDDKRLTTVSTQDLVRSYQPT